MRNCACMHWTTTITIATNVHVHSNKFCTTVQLFRMKRALDNLWSHIKCTPLHRWTCNLLCQTIVIIYCQMIRQSKIWVILWVCALLRWWWMFLKSINEIVVDWLFHWSIAFVFHLSTIKPSIKYRAHHIATRKAKKNANYFMKLNVVFKLGDWNGNKFVVCDGIKWLNMAFYTHRMPKLVM